MKADLEIIPVSHVDEVLKIALTQPLTPIVWTEADELAAVTMHAATQPNPGGAAVTH